jgi:predicted TIM-barrel fold metal-dependent hydrolase
MESIEKIIDFHTHIGDVINGLELFYYKEKKPRRRIIFLFELMRYNNIFGGIPKFLDIPISVEIQNRHAWSTKEKLLKSMKKNGINCSIVHPIDPIKKTEDILNLTDGKNLIPFASVSPDDPDKGIKLKNYVQKGCKGLKLHPILQKRPPDYKGYFEILEEARSITIPVLFHSGPVNYYPTKNLYYEYGRIEKFEKIIKEFPKIRFILAHMGLEEADKAIALAERFKNIYLDTSFQPLKKIIKAIDKIGERRLLFASDWPSSFQETPVKILKRLLKYKPRSVPSIAFKNAEELLNLTL